MSPRAGRLPYQKSIDLYLLDCAKKRKKLTILESSKPGITRCLAIVAGQRVPESLIDTLIDQMRI